MKAPHLWGKKNARYRVCCYCERHIPVSEITQEHLVPQHAGGRTTTPCCWKCNQEKGGQFLIDYAADLIELLNWMKARPKRQAFMVKYHSEIFIDFEKEIKTTRRKITNCIKFIKMLDPDLYDIL